MPVRKPATRWPWDTVHLEPHEVSAIKSIAHTMPIAWGALEKITAVDAMEFTAGGEDGRRASDFAAGKRWVGRQLRNIRDGAMPGPGPATPPSRQGPPE